MLRPTHTSSSMLGALALGFVLTGCGEEATEPAATPFGDGSISNVYPEAGWPEAGTGTSTNPVLPAASALPANVCTVLQNNGCIGCHKAQLEGGAQFPLQTKAEFAPFAAKVLARVQDPVRPMPPVTTMRPLMSAADVAVLKTWIDGGMVPAQGTACQVTGSNAVQPGDGGVTGTPDAGGGFVEDEIPTSSPAGAPTWATQPWPEGECEYVMKIGAHGQNNTPFATDTSKFSVPAQHTSYYCFYEKVPWGNKKVQALATRVRFGSPDDRALVHHLVLGGRGPNDGSSIAGQSPSGPGNFKPCDNPSGNTVGVYAPGALNPATFPNDVGLLMPQGDNAYMELQVHYNNTNNAAGKKSRVYYEICATSKLRPQTAGVFWLGYENAGPLTLAPGAEFLGEKLDNKGGGLATGVCSAKTRARVLWMAPHMHQEGIHAKVEVLRANGQPEVLHDKPFDFQEQTAYFKDNLWVENGERMRTSCKWKKSPVYFGFASDKEMCFVYTLAYPIEAFKPNTAEKGIVGGDLACAHQGG